MTRFYHTAQQPFPTSRVCTKCGIEKPLEMFNKHKNGLYGRRSRCVPCEVSYNREYLALRKNLPPLPPPTLPSYKTCSKCGRELPYPQSYYPREAACKECRIAYVVESHRTPEYKERHRQEYLRNKDKRAAYYVENKETYRATGRAWRKANPEKARASHIRRKAHRVNATVEPTEYKVIIERDGYWCYICGKDIDPSAKSRSSAGLTFDHIIPLQPRLGEPQGVHSEENIRPAHHSCNVRKGNIPFELLTPWQRRGV